MAIVICTYIFLITKLMGPMYLLVLKFLMVSSLLLHQYTAGEFLQLYDMLDLQGGVICMCINKHKNFEQLFQAINHQHQNITHNFSPALINGMYSIDTSTMIAVMNHRFIPTNHKTLLTN